MGRTFSAGDSQAWRAWQPRSPEALGGKASHRHRCLERPQDQVGTLLPCPREGHNSLKDGIRAVTGVQKRAMQRESQGAMFGSLFNHGNKGQARAAEADHPHGGGGLSSESPPQAAISCAVKVGRAPWYSPPKKNKEGGGGGRRKPASVGSPAIAEQFLSTLILQ